MKLDSLRELFVAKLRDLYDAEQQFIQALPRVAESCDADELREGVEAHLKQTQSQAERLEKIFRRLSEKPAGKTCTVAAALIKEADELLAYRDTTEPVVLDAALIAALQSIEHYEIAGYGCVRAYAALLEDEAEDVLQAILEEEELQDEQLTRIAEEVVNLDAAAGMDEEEEEAASNG